MLYFSNSLRLIFIHVMQGIPSIAEDKNKEINLVEEEQEQSRIG